MHLQVENILGLTVFHRDHVSAVDGSTMELSDELRRKLVVVPASEANTHQMTSDVHESMKVVWRFHDQANDEEEACTHCSHCRHMGGGQR